MSRLQFALDQIVAARRYTEELLGHVPDSDWFRVPAGGVTHVAWQVGHLAMAEYRLTLERIRGGRPEDEALISREFLALFGKDSVPHADASKYPDPAAIRAVFDRVHRQALAELPGVDEADLDRPPHKPHKLFDTRHGALAWCSRHEMLHAGQIGLLRRHLGHAYVW